MGATLLAAGATFRVWAPNAHEVHVLSDFTGWSPAPGTRLLAAGGYWWGFVRGAHDRQAYKFWVVGDAGGGWKRDPYARELDWGSGNCILRRPDFPWHDTGFVTPRFENFVIYQLHVGVFSTPRWPPGGGTFLDVAARLPYLADLGVTALQLLPIQEFPTTFSLGYNGLDYFSPEADFAVPDAELPAYVASTNATACVEGLVAVWRGGPEGRDEPAEGAGGSGARAWDRRDLRRGLQPCRRRLRRSEPVLLRPAARAAATRAVREFPLLRAARARGRARVRFLQAPSVRFPDPQCLLPAAGVPHRRPALRPGQRDRPRWLAARLALLPGPDLDRALPSSRRAAACGILGPEPLGRTPCQRGWCRLRHDAEQHAAHRRAGRLAGGELLRHRSAAHAAARRQPLARRVRRGLALCPGSREPRRRAARSGCVQRA